MDISSRAVERYLESGDVTLKPRLLLVCTVREPRKIAPGVGTNMEKVPECEERSCPELFAQKKEIRVFGPELLV